MGKRDFNHVATEEVKDEWLTPPDIIRALGAFALDPCAPHRIRRPWATAEHHFTGAGDGLHSEDKDGLLAPWEGCVWLNPPYGTKTFDWMNRLAKHKSGIALIFARTETNGFHDELWNKAHGMFFFRGRLCFWHQPFKSIIEPAAQLDIAAYDKAMMAYREKLEKTAQKYFKASYEMLSPAQLEEWKKGDTSNAPSCLVSYSQEDSDAIVYAREAGHIKGRFIRL